MREIDGSDGGGQILRSSLTLAALTGEAVRIEHIRGSRPSPGLKPQHLTAVRAVSAVCDATVQGADEGSEELVFEPSSLRPGAYRFDVGTAGSVTLVFETLLPLATALGEPLSVTVTGGTDVKWAPTMAHYQHVKLPLLRRFGLFATVEEEIAGFYPRGGGEATLRLAPSDPSRIELTERGELRGVRVYSTESADLASADVAARQATAAVPEFDGAARVPTRERVLRTVESPATGTAVCVRLDYAKTLAGFDALGEPGVPAEEVGREAATAARSFHEGAGAVDPHVADQLVLPLALCGGRVRVSHVTPHVATNVGVMRAFGYDIDVDERGTHAILSA
ncbi:RNA 3'-terminal phosphate cyclase [Haloarchaeobius sp. TZWWS8]|uniref:RNA 3'-terminal phosphate cyclase n=1 Tax=Haloarchaeobius sp. TZWWS8 TaxID=3446121 RepID=UPI003EBCA215